MSKSIPVLAAVLVCALGGNAIAQEPKSVQVTVDNFCRAETDNYFTRFVKEAGLGKFQHDRELAPIDKQTVIRLNRDTLYSFAVFDLDVGPVTVTLPDAGKRFMSMLVIDEDHYALQAIYTPGPHTFSKDKIGTRYICLAIRTFVNPSDPEDLRAVHALQDAIGIEQSNAGRFEVPAWDQDSLTKIRKALLALADANGGIDSARMFGRKDQVDPVQHLIGTAAGWGGNPVADAFYSGGSVKDNDGKTAYTLTLKDVPVDGFWSVSVYNKDGYFEKNAKDAYTFNNVTAIPAADGSATIHFGGDESAENYLPITPGWNYLIRLYRPRKAVLDGTWKSPEPQPVK